MIEWATGKYENFRHKIEKIEERKRAGIAIGSLLLAWEGLEIIDKSVDGEGIMQSQTFARHGVKWTRNYGEIENQKLLDIVREEAKDNIKYRTRVFLITSGKNSIAHYSEMVLEEEEEENEKPVDGFMAFGNKEIFEEIENVRQELITLGSAVEE